MSEHNMLPEGWALVPIEPTDKMVRACYHIDLSYMPGQEGADGAAIYRAMLAAAPQPVAQPVYCYKHDPDEPVSGCKYCDTQPKPEQPTYTEDEIADAAMLAEIPDSKLESLLIVLAASPKPKD